MIGFLRAYGRNKGALAGVVVVLLVCLLAAVAGMLFPFSPWDMQGAPFQPPGEPDFLLGSDSLGRDVAAGIAYGARVSLLIGAVSTAVALLLGVSLGAIAGYAGGAMDDAIMCFTEFFQTVPSFILAIVLVAIFSPSLGSIVAAIAIVSWPPVTRVVRAEFLSLRSREFVQAAEVLGHSHAAIVFREILPNALVLLCHSFCATSRWRLCPQQGHCGSACAKARARRIRNVAIECGMWRCERSGRSSGSITIGNGRLRAAPGAGRS